MRVISRKKLKSFYEQHADARSALEAWYAEANHAEWRTPQDIKAKYATASIVANHRVVFNICGNKYRLVVCFAYTAGIAFIRFVGTHKQYDKIDVEAI